MSKDYMDNLDLTSNSADRIQLPSVALSDSIKSIIDIYKAAINRISYQDVLSDSLKRLSNSFRDISKAIDFDSISALTNMQSIAQGISGAASATSAMYLQSTLDVLRNIDFSGLTRIEAASQIIDSIPDDITIDTVSELIENGEITDEYLQAELKSTITGTENEAVKGKSSIIQKALKFVAIQIILFLLATVFSPVTDKVKKEIVESFRIDEFWQNTGIVDWIDSWSESSHAATEDEAKATVDESKTGNISKQKREDLLSKVKEIRNYISNAPQDENTANLLTYLSEIEKDINGKKYGLVFEKHREDIDEVLDTHTPVLTEETDLFIDNGGQINSLIEGDNLASLKLLEKTHKGKIDAIYIDPPYNTGKNDFRYDDTFIESEDMFRHSKWTSFVNKRLRLAHTLLKDNGIIFISIDDNEYSAMKMICDEIWGENNRVATFAWKKRYQGAKERHIVICHEYILMYCKNKALLPSLFVPSDEEYAKKYFKQSDEYGKYRTQPLEAGKSMDDRENLVFSITAPDGSFVYPKRQWIWSKEHVEEGIRNHTIGFSKNKSGEWTVFIKQYLHDSKGEQRKTKQFSIIDGIYTQHGTKEIENIFGDGNTFKFPKPSKLIHKLLQTVPYGNNIKVLDFFAGSGTTGHAVMQLNAEDNGNRRFILCTNNENNICREVTYERIKRVIDKENYNASLKYYKVEYVPINERLYYEYADELLLHIRELLELENGINFAGNSDIAIVLTDEELEDFTQNIELYPECRKLYMGHDLLPDEDQERIFAENNIEINIIPDYYYRDLQES